MNSFGRLFRVSMLGESHGECVGILIDGCPAGIKIDTDSMAADLERRKGGRPGTTSRVESDIPLLKSGVMKGVSTGAPILIIFDNKDVDSSFYKENRFLPRPGHADFPSMKKFGGFNDYRGGGHFSGRLTAALVAAGSIAKQLLDGVTVKAELIEAGGSEDFRSAINSAVKEKDSVGGVVRCSVDGLPVGLGEPFFDSVESMISHAVFSVPAVKGIEFGSGFAGCKLRGSEFNDAIIDASGRTKTNNSGGINGGLTNGNRLVFSAAVRPTSSVPVRQETVNIKTGQKEQLAVKGRHDACIALRVPVVIEAVTAIVLADLMKIGQLVPNVSGDVS